MRYGSPSWMSFHGRLSSCLSWLPVICSFRFIIPQKTFSGRGPSGFFLRSLFGRWSMHLYGVNPCRISRTWFGISTMRPGTCGLSICLSDCIWLCRCFPHGPKKWGSVSCRSIWASGFSPRSSRLSGIGSAAPLRSYMVLPVFPIPPSIRFGEKPVGIRMGFSIT